MKHYWQGKYIDSAEVLGRLRDLDALTGRELGTPLPARVVLAACGVVSGDLSAPGSALRTRLAEYLDATDIAALAREFEPRNWEGRLHRELGESLDPSRLRRPEARHTIYEAWAPLGLLVHIAPGNAPAVGALSVVEGLVTGNVNVLKTASDGAAPSVSTLLLEALCQADPTGAIARHLIVLSFSSREQQWLEALCRHADGIAIWGGEEAVRSISALAPEGCRVVAWGHRISFAYLTSSAARDPQVLDAVVTDACRLEQQACSSPQVVYLDSEDPSELRELGEQLARRLAASAVASVQPSEAERAEITTVQRVAELEQHLVLTTVFADPQGGWRVIVDSRPALSASPLYRSLWVKPLPRTRIVEVLRPMRRYLQTTGLAGTPAEVAELSRALLSAGVTRITSPGAMVEGYPGEPHDGLYSLQRYSRRVSVRRTEEDYRTIAALDDLLAVRGTTPRPSGPIIGKEKVQRALPTVAACDAQLSFQTGGSSGTPALSLYTYRDYNTQMRAVAEGLLAAGFDPARDRTANLFVGGNMYGGFLSFFTTLEYLGATQLPISISGTPDYERLARQIIEHRADTLFIMPSHLWRLLHEQRSAFLSYGGLRKIYYGGEHFTKAQRTTLREEFGINVIRSAAYGSTDLGPLGYQCTHSSGAIHHIHSQLLDFEIVHLDSDTPVNPGETGRLILSSRVRAGQKLERYEIGDLAREVTEPCGCGSRLPRVELMGRHGDIMRMATRSFHYRQFTEVLERRFSHTAEVQLVVDWHGDRERLVVLIDGAGCAVSCGGAGGFAGAVRRALDEEVPYLKASQEEGLLSVEVRFVDPADMERVASSGKLRRVVDRR